MTEFMLVESSSRPGVIGPDDDGVVVVPSDHSTGESGSEGCVRVLDTMAVRSSVESGINLVLAVTARKLGTHEEG